VYFEEKDLIGRGNFGDVYKGLKAMLVRAEIILLFKFRLYFNLAVFLIK